MRLTYILIILLFSLISTAGAVTHTVTTPGFTFSPSTLSISLGDTIVFNIDPMHNVVEVSQSTWNANGNTPLPSGFSLPSGGGTLVLQSVGTYYYVCSPHAGGGMKGSITVSSTTITTGTLSSLNICKGASLVVPFTITGTFNGGNVFTAQLSNGAGSFASPTAIGTLSGTGSGQINAVIPAGTPVGLAYRVRVVSSSPAVTGSDNGSDVTVLDAPIAIITPAGPTSFCEGQSVQLDAPTGAGLTYTWRLNGTPISAAAGASYIATLPGQYSVVVSNGSCSTTSANQRVIVYPTNPTTLVWAANIDTDWNTLGNWDNPCAIPTAGDTVTINAGVTPPAQVPAMALGKLTLNNASGLQLGGDLEIAGNLTLSSGTITLGSSNLILAPTAGISGASQTNFIVTDGSGALRQAGIGSGARSGAVLFPVGSSASGYTPVTITNTGTADEFAVRVSDDVLDGGTSGTPLGSNVVDRTWFISESTAGGSNATLAFEWGIVDELGPFDRAACYVAHHDGADWQQLQSLGAATGGGPYQRSVSGVTAFSPFAIGDGGSPLPVEYRSLSADVIGDAVLIRWETEREINSHGFAIERSREEDASWFTLGFIESTGGALRGARYEQRDIPPSAGQWRYRLRQFDMDGTESLSPVLVVDISDAPVVNSQAALAIQAAWPNPLRKSLSTEAGVAIHSTLGGTAVLTLHDLLGRRVAEVFRGTVEAGRGATARFDVSALSPGIYFYRLSVGAATAHHRLVIMR